MSALSCIVICCLGLAEASGVNQSAARLSSTLRLRPEGSSPKSIPGSTELAEVNPQSPIAPSLADPDQSVTAGREALNRWLEYPWYDRESDSVRPVNLAPRRRTSSEVSTLNLDWLTVLAWTVIALLLIGLAYLLIRAYLDYENRTALPATARQGPATEVDRIEALPFMAARTQTDLLAEARRQYEQGNYREAIIYLFSYELIHLDQHGIVRLARGKTNRQYVREARARGPLASLLEQTMVAFEAVFFGQHQLDRSGFEACWNEVNEFQRLASQT